MNGLQQKVVSEKIARDQNFVNVFMTDITNKRNLRVKSVDVAFATLSTARVATEANRGIAAEVDPKKLIVLATSIYEFISKDGGLETIESPPQIVR